MQKNQGNILIVKLKVAIIIPCQWLACIRAFKPPNQSNHIQTA